MICHFKKMIPLKIKCSHVHEKNQESHKQNIIVLMCNYGSQEMFIFFWVLPSLTNFPIRMLNAFHENLF